MAVDLLLGTEQAVMLDSISTTNIIPCIIDVAVVINVYLVAFADVGVGHSDTEGSMAVVHIMCLQWLQVFQYCSLTYSSGQYWYMFCSCSVFTS